jgi:serum/glucocorticoid-regulated kinase 2
MDYAF